MIISPASTNLTPCFHLAPKSILGLAARVGFLLKISQISLLLCPTGSKGPLSFSMMTKVLPSLHWPAGPKPELWCPTPALTLGCWAHWPPGYFFCSAGMLLPQAPCTCFLLCLDRSSQIFLHGSLLSVLFFEYHLPSEDSSISSFKIAPPVHPSAP